MNIHLHNYEEYFILYMDNELNSDDRREVEEFVQKNPDLKEDLDILMQYKLVPDTDIVFAGKEELMKQGDLVPNNQDSLATNYREWLMLYMDNELEAEQRITVEQFIARHPAANKELAILMQTRLQPEEISFPHKESLYRKEEVADRRLIIPVRWWRIAAAAVLFIVIGLTLAIALNKKSSGNKPEMAKVPGNNQKTKTENPVLVKKEEHKPAPLPIISDNAENVIVSTSGQPNNKLAVKHKDIAVNEKKLPNKIVDQKDDKQKPMITDLTENHPKPSNNLPQLLNPSIINNQSSEIGTARITEPKEKIIPQELTSNVPVTTTATPTSYNGDETKSSINDGLNQSGGKKSKLRGFFRKITRTFEKTTKINSTDEDRVLIGGLAFKLK